MRRRTFLLGFGAAALAAAFESPSEPKLGTIAYILKDGLWVLDLPASRARRILAGGKLQYPKFSPSGEWITYKQNDRDYKIRVDGSSRTRVEQLGPTVINKALAPTDMVWGWNRERTVLIYWREPEQTADHADGLDLYHLAIASGKASSLGLATLVDDDLLMLSPVGDELAVTAGDGRETWTNKRIAIIDLKAGKHTYLTDEKTAELYPSWSPDATKIAYCAGPDGEIVENDERLARGERTYKVMQPNGKVKTMPITPETRIGVSDPLRYMKRRRIWITDTHNSSRATQITNDRRYRDEKPFWSRNGARILFCRLEGTGTGTLWLMKPDGSDATQLTAPLAFDPWSLSTTATILGPACSTGTSRFRDTA